MKISLIAAAAAALALTAPISQATVINSAYTSLGANSWRVDFTVTNDGTPASFAGFTIDFPNATNLVLRASPATWDSAVFQPDANLPDDGFLDSFARASSNVLTPGQSLGGFAVSFAYAAGAVPGALPFMLYSENFTPVFAGMTTTVAAIPEPETLFLCALGLALVGARTARTRGKNCSMTKKVSA